MTVLWPFRFWRGTDLFTTPFMIRRWPTPRYTCTPINLYISSLTFNYLLLNLVLRLSKNASLVLIVPGSGNGLPGLLDSLVTAPSGISFEPPGTLIGVDMDSLSPSLNSLVILLAVRLCMKTCLFACLSALRSLRMFSLLLLRFE